MRGSRIIGAVLAAVTTTSAVVVTAAPATGATSTSVIFYGGGYGHGVGMSQYGARAMALAGKTAGGIVRHYYKGVSFAQRPVEYIRVLLESSANVAVTSAQPFGAWSGATELGRSTAAEPYLKAIPISTGIKVQRAPSKTGPWTTLATVTTGPVVFKPDGASLEHVFDNLALQTYRGTIEAYRTSSTMIRSINVIALEAYLWGVIPWEMPSSWPAEALQAQAIVARSYAVNQKLRRRAAGSYYDICATTACQVYGGKDAEAASSTAAVKATPRTIATHPDPATTAEGVILATFFSSSGGKTENNTDGFGGSIQYPYLVSRNDPWSIAEAAKNPYATWDDSVTPASVASAVGLTTFVSARVTKRNASGSADTIAFTGIKNGARTTISKTGLWARSEFGLRSIYVTSIYSPPFTDDDASIFQPDIIAIWKAGVTVGCGSGRYCPEAPLSRAQMATFLTRALDLPEATTDHFVDDAGNIHEDSINRLAEAGITVGCGETTFCPDAPVTRAQMATFLARGFELPPSTTDHFTDDDGTTHEAAINSIADAGITVGCGAGLFCPGRIVTRAQMAAFLARALNLP